MSRHLAPVPRARRLAGAGLGIATIVVLALLIWAISNPPATAPPEAEAPVTEVTPAETAPADQTTIPAPSTTPPSTATTAGIPTSTSPPPTTIPPLRLLPDGLGATMLGDLHDQAVEAVAAIAGPPEEDSGWIAARSDFGTCPGTVVRMVRWGGLRLFSSDGPTDFGEDSRHFFHYSLSVHDGPADPSATDMQQLTTEAGIGLGSSLLELREAYRTALEVTSTLQFGPVFSVAHDGEGLLSGALTGVDPAAEVTMIAGGFGCGG